MKISQNLIHTPTHRQLRWCTPGMAKNCVKCRKINEIATYIASMTWPMRWESPKHFCSQILRFYWVRKPSRWEIQELFLSDTIQSWISTKARKKCFSRLNTRLGTPKFSLLSAFALNIYSVSSCVAYSHLYRDVHEKAKRNIKELHVCDPPGFDSEERPSRSEKSAMLRPWNVTKTVHIREKQMESFEAQLWRM